MPKTNDTINFSANTENVGVRLDVFLSKNIDGWSRSRLKRLIDDGDVLVNGGAIKSSYKLRDDDEIAVELVVQDSEAFEPEEIPIEIVFEDDYLAVIYKPSGILVSGNKFVTIANALSQNLKKSPQFDAVKPQPIHRLDYPTSGLLLIGKTSTAIIALGKLFKLKEIKKTYYAITIGETCCAGVINLNVDNKKASTDFKVLSSVKSERFNFLNLVELQPKTGRKHQLRKHLSVLGTPILGDKEYFLEHKILNGKGLYLHAATLDFKHPFTGKKIVITKELPKKFTKIFSEF